jgi:uncharacterized protein
MTMKTPNGTLDTKPWWRYGHLWLVISGPLVVVVAAIITAYIAMRAPDPVLAEDYYKRGIEINKTLEKQQGLTPALQARNHAATPVVDPAASSVNTGVKR